MAQVQADTSFPLCLPAHTVCLMQHSGGPTRVTEDADGKPLDNDAAARTVRLLSEWQKVAARAVSSDSPMAGNGRHPSFGREMRFTSLEYGK